MMSTGSPSNRSYMIRQSVAMSEHNKSNSMSNPYKGKADSVSNEFSYNNSNIAEDSDAIERLEPSKSLNLLEAGSSHASKDLSDKAMV